MKIDIKSLSKEELGKELVKLGAQAYRAQQVFRWLYKVGVKSFDEMTDLPAELRAKLKDACHIEHPSMLDMRRSGLDGTTKYLLKLEDGNTIETVYLPETDRATVCLSSQVGCKYACSFCASAPFGFKRNLHVAEILDEVLFVRAKHPEMPVTNLVFMGIGEPLDNYDHVLRAIRILNDPDAFGIGARRMTVSTCGLIPAMEKLAGEGIQVELSVSLHSADDAVRSTLVPVNKKYPLADLMKACRAYTHATNRIITFEYILIKGVNASKDDAIKVAKLLKGLKCKVNTIAYNQIKALGFDAPTARDVEAFVRTLKDAGVNVMHRRSKGEDIDAGCGQLRIARM